MPLLTEIPASWDFPEQGSPLLDESIALLNYLMPKVFSDYEPSQFHPFRERLIDWLNNVDETYDQQMLLAILLDVFYVGRREFEALFRSAYRGSITRWIVDLERIDVFSENADRAVAENANNAWICPVSDSLRINSFLKVNGLKSKDVRPDWRSLRRLGDISKIQDYVLKCKIGKLILLEDFVGSGVQAQAAIRFASQTLPHVEILFCPLVVCPSGDIVMEKLASALPNVQYDPVLVLPPEAVLGYDETTIGPFAPVDEFLRRIMPRLSVLSEREMYGFEATGAKVVLFSNCPNNTLPIFHYDTETWKPLFPRVTRQ